MIRVLAGRALRLAPAPIQTAVADWRAKGREAAVVRAAAREGMTPPQFMWGMVGGPDRFVELGREFSDYLIEHGRLTPASSVLDVGCGLGKHALHLAPYLARGRLEGFDVEKRSIDWCRLAITPRYPNARFRHIPLKSDMYSPGSTASAASFRFPYGDSRFDLAFLGSVFTHMFTADTDNYIREIARVLKPGGRCIATMYLLNNASRAGIAAGASVFTFAIPRGDGCWLEQSDPPEAAVAHDETATLAMFAASGLTLAEPVRYGVWPTRALQDQDFLVLKKRTAG